MHPRAVDEPETRDSPIAVMIYFIRRERLVAVIVDSVTRLRRAREHEKISIVAIATKTPRADSVAVVVVIYAVAGHLHHDGGVFHCWGITWRGEWARARRNKDKR
jgi:hypothetical protein